MTELWLRQLKLARQHLEKDHSQQMEQVQRQAREDVERSQMRSEAEIADLRATISRHEVNLMKVCQTMRSRFNLVSQRYILTVPRQASKTRAQELQVLQETLSEKLAEQTHAVEEAIGRLKVSESNLFEETAKRKQVSTRWGEISLATVATGLTRTGIGRGGVAENARGQTRHSNRA